MLSSCCPLTQQRLKGLSCYFFIACLFQGLTLIMLKSNVCSKGFFEAYFVGVPDINAVVQDVSCGIDRGAKLAISATVLYFMCMCQVPAAVAPTPVGYERGGGGDDDVEAEGGAAEAEGGAAAE